MNKLFFSTVIMLSSYSFAQSSNQMTCKIDISGHIFKASASTESEAAQKTHELCTETFGTKPCVLAIPECSQEQKKESASPSKRMPIDKMSNLEMEKSRRKILSQLKDETMGEVFSYQMQLAPGSTLKQIKKTLIEAYIDETLVKVTQNTASEVQEAVNLLCYQADGCASPAGEKKLDKIKSIVSKLLTNQSMSLIILDSNGMGTFGQAQGLAIHDAETNQVFIIMSGYAE